MLKRYRIFAGIVALLLPMMWGTGRADCAYGNDGGRASVDSGGSTVSPGESHDGKVAGESNAGIGTGTMPGSGPDAITLFRNRPLDDILGISPGPEYRGPWREGVER